METVLELHNLSVGYGEEPILEHVELQLHRGEVLAILSEGDEARLDRARERRAEDLSG